MSVVEHLVTGVVGRPHGTGGYLKVTSLSGELDHFRSLKDIVLVGGTKRTQMRIEHVRTTGNGVLMKLEGVDSPEAARAYTGLEIWVPRDEAAPLGDEEYYVADVCGCILEFDGATVGEIAAVCEGGNGMLLDVARRDGGRVFVPFIPEFIGDVDIARRTVELIAGWVLE